MNNINQNSLVRAQNVLFDMLCAIDAVFERRGIKYAIMWGTLLGAVRHNGFIPWDDDIDINILDDDYDEAIKLLRLELDPRLYAVQNHLSDPQYWSTSARIRSKCTEIETNDANPASNILNIRYTGLWVSLFRTRRVKRANVLLQLFRIHFQHGHNISSSIRTLKSDVRTLLYKMILATLSFLMRLIDKLPGSVVNFVTNYPFVTRYFNGHYFPDEDIYPLGTLEFCGKQFPVPKNYHKVLTEVYGDYMRLPPPEKRRSHLAEVRFTGPDPSDHPGQNEIH